MMMPFTPFTFSSLLVFLIWGLFLVLVLVDNKAFPDSTRLLLVFIGFFRAICRNSAIGFVSLGIHRHIFPLSFLKFGLRRR
jgi:hypothetical protein